MIMCAGLRPVGFDRDSQNYEYTFLHPDSNTSNFIVEPFFIFICKILYIISPDFQILLLFFAFTCIVIKLTAIARLTPLLFLSLTIYFSNFYMLHEITQIRAGVVSGLFLLSLKPLSEGKKMLPFFLILLGSMFHFSSFALLPVLFFDNNTIGRIYKIFLACIIPFCFILYALDLDLLTTINIPYMTAKIEAYKSLSEFGNIAKESILNPFPLIKMTIFLYLLFFSKKIEEYVPSINIIIKIIAYSLIIYFAFSSVKIISTRVSELYGIVEIVAYPCILFTIRPHFVGKIIVSIIAIIEIYFNVFQWSFFDLKI